MNYQLRADEVLADTVLSVFHCNSMQNVHAIHKNLNYISTDKLVIILGIIMIH